MCVFPYCLPKSSFPCILMRSYEVTTSALPIGLQIDPTNNKVNNIKSHQCMSTRFMALRLSTMNASKRVRRIRISCVCTDRQIDSVYIITNNELSEPYSRHSLYFNTSLTPLKKDKHTGNIQPTHIITSIKGGQLYTYKKKYIYYQFLLCSVNLEKFTPNVVQVRKNSGGKD